MSNCCFTLAQRADRPQEHQPTGTNSFCDYTCCPRDPDSKKCATCDLGSQTLNYYLLTSKRWSESPCTSKGCTDQIHQPSGTSSFCGCMSCPRNEGTRKCTTCGLREHYVDSANLFT